MTKPHVLLLGFTVPDAEARGLFSLDSSPAVQTHKFAWSLARALQAAFGGVVLASACPIQNYPLGRKLLFRGSQFEENGIKGALLGFVNLLVLKHLTRFIACLLTLPLLMMRHKVEWMFIHGTHTPFLLSGLLARLFGRKLAVVLTDLPGVILPTDSRLARALKRVDIWVVGGVLARADAVIALAPALVKQFAIRKPSLVIPGILDSTIVAQASKTAIKSIPTKPFMIIYAGSLSSAYGVDRLLDAIQGLDGFDVRIKLFGRGDQEPKIKALVACDARFQYGGFVGNEQLIPELRKADLLINARPTHEAFALMSFPSKLIEYLAMGRPVLTTRIVSIPQSYMPHLYFIDDESPEGIRRAILGVMATPPIERESRAAHAQKFICAESSEMATGHQIAQLIRSI
jgi:glycosyltransferase involved in cell wall biosynthesis